MRGLRRSSHKQGCSHRRHRLANLFRSRRRSARGLPLLAPPLSFSGADRLLWTARVGARVLSTRSCQSNSNTSAHEERSRQSRLLRKPELSKEIRLLLHAEPKTPPPAASIGPTAGWSVLPGSFGNGWPWIAGVCRRASSPTHGLTIFPIACMSAPSTIRRQGSPTLWGSRCQQAFGP